MTIALLKAGIIGTGFIGPVHLEALRRNGIPVAAVAVNGAKNAAVLAARVLALKYPEVRAALSAYRKELAEGGSK